MSGIGTYKGDSPGKKLARTIFWNEMAEKKILEHDRRNTVLTLCGSGGDSRTLQGLGFPRGTVVSAELDRTALDSYAEVAGLNPLRIIRGDELVSTLVDGKSELVLHHDVRDTASLLQVAKVKADVIFLDFCSPLLQRNVQCALRCAQRCLRPGGVLALGFMYGREQKSNKTGRLVSNLRNHVDNAPEQRVLAVEYMMRKEEKRFGLRLNYMMSVAYSSVTEGSKGVPMLYVGWKRVGSGMAPLRGIPKGEPYCRIFGSFKEIETRLRDLVLDMSSRVGTEPVAAMFSLSPGTIAAWKAHRTRGSYGTDPSGFLPKTAEITL